MNAPILQIAAWFVALAELSVGLYVLLINVWHNANRHVSALLLLTAANTFAVGMLMTASSVHEAALPLIIQAMTTPATMIGLLLVGIVLLKPDWMRGRRLWLWLPLYGIGLLAAILTLVDVSFGTRLWYTGPDPRTYVGGNLPLGEYAAGRIALPLQVICNYLAPVAALIFLLYVAASLTRRLAWLLFGALAVGALVQFGLRDVLGPAVTALVASTAYAGAYTSAAFRQMASGRIPQRGRLQTRLVLLLLAITLPLLVAVSLFLINQGGALLGQDAAERLRASRSALETSTSVWLDLNIKALAQLVNQPDIVSMDPARQRPALRAMAAAFPHMYLVSTTDLNGRNVARNDDTALLDYSDRQWFRDARDGTPLTFQTLIGRTTNKPALVVSMPIKNKSGEIVGVGMFATELTSIAQSVEAARIGQTGYAYIIDANNRVVAHPDPAFLTTQDNQLVDASSFAPVRALRLGTQGVYAYRDPAGARWRADIAAMDYKWGVIVQQQEGELFSALQLFRGTSGGALAVGVILLAGTIWLTVRQAIQPVGALTETVEAITAGDLTRVAPMETEDELGTLARAFNSMTGQLRGIIENLEQRVAERTAGLREAAAESVRHTGELERLNLDLRNASRQAERRAAQLAASAQVAHAAIQVRDLDQLLPQVTHLISQAFGYYHVGIFIVDEVGRFAILRAANSEGGQRMLARGHKLAVGKEGIVGYVTGTGQARIALDVGADAVHFDNPDLPQTRSEMALPLRVRDPRQEASPLQGVADPLKMVTGPVFGALDVQSTQEAAFAEEDVAVLSTLADQVAIAIENARLFAQAQAALQEAEDAQRRYLRQEWAQLLTVMQPTSHEYHVSGVPPVGDAPLPEMEQAIQQGRAVTVVGSEMPFKGGDSLPAKAALAMPIKLRDQLIGVIDLQEADAERQWTDEDVAMVTAVADQVALALENARLFEQTQMSLADTRALYEASAQINSATTLDEILSALRQHTELGQADLIVAINLFDTPWVGDRIPETIEVALRWTTLPAESLSNRYNLERFPAARLLRPDEPFVVADIEHDERLDDVVRQLYWGTLHAHSALLVPLVVAGLWIGFVDAIWSERREFAESDLRRIMLLSGQAATAVQTRRLFEQTQARVQQLAALNEISRAASGLLETAKLLTVIREQIQRIVKMDTFFVGLHDFQTRVISYPICYDDGRPYEMPPEQLSPDARSYGVIFSGEPLLVEYSPEDRERILLAPDNMMGDASRVSASLIYVPLRIGDRVIGVMSVQSYAPHVYTQEHVGLMMAIANQVAVALENTRLFEQARHRAVQLATASEAGRAATSILDMNELLQSVVDLVCSRFGYDHAAVFLLDETGQFAILRDATGAAPQDKAGPAIQQLKLGGYQFAVGGQSLVGWVTSKGRSRVVTEVNDDARYLKTDLWPQSRSELCIPLKRGEHVIGALDVHSTNLAAFSQDDVVVLEMLTDQLAIAIQNARLYGQTREQSVILEKRAADLAVLNEASRLMAQTFDPAEILNSAAQVIVRHFGVGHAAILLFPEGNLRLNESKTVLRVAAECPDRGTIGAEALVAGSAALMEYIASQRAAAIDDVITDPRMESLRMSFLQLSIRSVVFLPLMVKNDLVGYIRLDAIGMLRRFTDEEVSLGQTLASQVAVALQNAWLYQAEQRRAARQSALYQVGRRMTASLDPSDLMNTVVESVQRDLGFERVLILLTDTANGEVYATAASTNFADLIPPNYRQRIGQGMIGFAAQSGQTQLANDTQANPKYYPVGAWNPSSELCVPLEVGGHVIGVLDVESDARGAFGGEDVRTLESLAGQLAVALENARLYEEQKQTAEKLREVDRLKTEFLANMSHELRTPLNSIIGFSRVILKGIDGPLTDLQKQDLEAIHGSGQQLLGLINDILDISKIEAGKMELAFQQVDLHDIIKGVMSSAVGLVKGKPIVLRQEVPDDLPTVWADVTRARQVLLNLVSNASKFTDKGSITVLARYDDLYVTVGVRDTGIGIPADKLETIFDEFTQVDASTTRQHGGTGLGLAITRRFVQMHGGRVWAESELNHGSTFYFSLPRTQQVAIEADTTLIAEPGTLSLGGTPSLGGKRLLLAVDDDLGVITLYKRYLEKRGYQVVGVTDSRQVIEQARRLKPDVITLDILMPNKDGWSVIQELHQTVDTRHIPVVVCSIISDQGKGFSLGAADYLVKPITEDELVIALKRLDGRNQATVLIIDDKLEDARLIRRILEAPRVEDPLLGVEDPLQGVKDPLQGGDGDRQSEIPFRGSEIPFREPLYVVQEAHSGAEAIAAVRQNMPNLVLLDLLSPPDLIGVTPLGSGGVMPKVDGLAVLEAIKSDPATRGIPVIVVTAKELTSRDHERLRGNIRALLVKGRFSEQDLLDDVAAALGARSLSVADPL